MHASHHPVAVFDAIRALAFIGDLSMGQPTDHSDRVARLACRIAQAAGMPSEAVHAVQDAALLRWSGCTANAAEVASVFGDDVAGRAAMLAMRPGWSASLARHGGTAAALRPLAEIHCEVSGQVAAMLGLPARVGEILLAIFEAWDGSGNPRGLRGAEIPPEVFVVVLAGDVEILGRTYGMAQAREIIRGKAQAAYPASLADIAIAHADAWLAELDRGGEATRDESPSRALEPTPATLRDAPLELIADVIDLKLPWMTGYSRAVATAAAACARRMALDDATMGAVYRAGLIHGIGRAAVPNAIWNTPGKLSAAAWEKVRLVPYWTARAGKQTGALADAAELASYAYERADGSGYFRAVGTPAVSQPAQIVAAAVAWVALRCARPWRAAMSDDEAASLLRGQADRGRFDHPIIEALLAGGTGVGAGWSGEAGVVGGVGVGCSGGGGVGIGGVKDTMDDAARPDAALLTPRERDVLRAISVGCTNKEAARELALSPSTVRTHVENVFRKLQCTTRAAAILKASSLGLL
ncbi:HD domain-containing phosphohydrolase [Bordetella bronchialis]|uniref:HD domain-containing phosphohydrolase n=1 Tax=Bordetella bronchialis TaxID=463025 RepID=UPI003D04E693